MDPEKDNFVLWFIGIMFLIVVAWVATGGPQDERARQGIFIVPLTEQNGGNGYGQSYLYSGDSSRKVGVELPPPIIDITKFGSDIENIKNKLSEVENIKVAPISSKYILIDGFSGAQGQTAQNEYVRLVANTGNKGPVTISSLVLDSSITGNSATLPNGDYLPVIGTVPSLKPISLVPNEQAIVSTGKSPLSTSFKVNICSGYLNQFQVYTPKLRSECPRPEADFDQSGMRDFVCRDYLKTLNQCEAFTGQLPNYLSSDCKKFIENRVNYNGCVMLHKDDVDFYRNEWRVFLGKTTELWKQSGEIIRLFDAKKNVIDAVAY